MKKILAVLITLCAATQIFAVANRVIAYSALDVNQKPSNIAVYKLGTCNSGQYDTLAAIGGAPNVYGPFPLSIDPTRPQFKGFICRPNLGAFDSGDSLKLEYQLLPSNKVTDTTSTWATVAAVLLTGVPSSYVDISALPGQSIVFKLTNIDQTAALIQAPIRMIMMETSTASSDAKR